MNINKELSESVLKTLPISYYAKREITTEISEDDTSYFSPLENRIVISLQNINAVMSHLKDIEDVEYIVRTILYHEISHALLTPASLKTGKTEVMADVINIFEDERIETILKNFYLGVNFKRNIIFLNNYKGEDATNAFEAYYFAVRFRHGKPYHNDLVNECINMYRELTSADSKTYYRETSVVSYAEDIERVYKEIIKDWLEENDKDSLTEENPGYDSCSDEEKGDIAERVVQKQMDEGKIDITNYIITDFKEGEPQNNKEGKVIEVTAEELDSMSEEIDGTIIMESKETKIQEMMDSILNPYIDNNLIEQIKEIFENFTSRTKNNSGAVQRYSGVLNPRAVGRDDWRIFEYKSQNGPVKGYDKLHLNLFIDTSGSYRSNEEQTNTILKALDVIESQYSYFSYDLVTCQVGEIKRSKKERYIKAWGGNRLDEQIFDIYNSLQVPTAFNYNIVLFDGDAFTDCGYRASSYYKNFGAFNNTKSSIISDHDNQEYIEKYAPLAHTIIVSDGGRSKTYSSMLYENIINVLTRALL